MNPAYVYAATVLSVHDGDTLTLDLDLGFSVHVRASVRLLGCNARELSEPGGKEARDHLRALLPLGTPVTARSVLVDKYGGRYDAAIALGDGTDLAQSLVDAHWLAAWNGTGARPLPPWPRPEETS